MTTTDVQMIKKCTTCGHRSCPSWCGGEPIGEWIARGSCIDADPELFFPQGKNGRLPIEITAEAKRICSTCPVRVDCLEYALVERLEHGVWGGMTPSDRSGRNNELLALIRKRRANEQRLAEVR